VRTQGIKLTVQAVWCLHINRKQVIIYQPTRCQFSEGLIFSNPAYENLKTSQCAPLLGPIHTIRHVSVPSTFPLHSVRLISVHTVCRVQSPSGIAGDTRPALISTMQPHSFSKRQLAAVALMLDEEEKNAALIKRSVCDHSSLICPHNFSFHTLSLYFLCDMSYNSSYLRTNSINFSSISDDNQAGLIASKHSKRSGDDVITAHVIRIEHVGLVPSRQTFSLGGRRRNGTET